MGTCVCCWGCVQHGCPGNAEERSGPSLPSVVPHHHQETGWQMYIKKGNEQTHPDPIMPYALFVLIGNFLSLCILSILLSPPHSGRMAWPQRWERPFLISLTHTTLPFGVFQENCYKTAQSYRGQSTASPQHQWPKVLEQPQVLKQTLPGCSWVSHRSALNRWHIHWFLGPYEVLAVFWCHPVPPVLSSGCSPGALCANRASWMTASFGWMALGSGSMGTGDPSLDRLSGVWTPLECADNTPEWLGEAGALL